MTDECIAHGWSHCDTIEATMPCPYCLLEEYEALRAAVRRERASEDCRADNYAKADLLALQYKENRALVDRLVKGEQG
jgi:hypothetical protein